MRARDVQALISPCPHSDKLSMCSSSSGQVITPGVESGGTKSGHVHLGKAPTSLHMSTQTPASLFWTCARCAKSSASQALDLDMSLADANGAEMSNTSKAADCIVGVSY